MPAVTRVTDVTHFLDHPFTCARARVERNGIIGHIGNNGNAALPACVVEQAEDGTR